MRLKSRTQQGSMLMISLVILVVMSLLAATLLRLLSASADTLVYEAYGLRALQSARAGLDNQLVALFPTSGASQCQVIDTNLGTLDGFSGCRFTSRCQHKSYDGGAIQYYRLTSTGLCQAEGFEVSRTLSVDAREIN
ncbi:type II secretory pathway protein [Aliiglaciecola sp. CAU 1673]|uniref:type II secretory pathway protein n=1 Tax=Aliiglaciecola sp. CAU 1673 TaxID=3032595 RepID=UPI0023DA030D|nr:type II secretory pathway protein [Aliiglaciecola sp. CAU 1673]MDF2179130.1 type II secretory pathway protein [Aliiglaciecola sp. CAU 1673]